MKIISIKEEKKIDALLYSFQSYCYVKLLSYRHANVGIEKSNGIHVDVSTYIFTYKTRGLSYSFGSNEEKS